MGSNEEKFEKEKQVKLPKKKVRLVHKICEHLVTKPKYNTLKIINEDLIDKLADKQTEITALKNQLKIEKEKFGKATDEYIEEITKLKLKLKEVKKK